MRFQEIIKEQREELEKIESSENIIQRDRIEEARDYLKTPNILAVLGIRRCGKSIFSYLLVKGTKMGYINFDDERLADLTVNDLNIVLQSLYELYGDIEYIVLDEIQNIDKWELFANRLRRSKKVIITGSNYKLLSGELSTHLTGRYIDMNIFPFSFQEFLRFKHQTLSNSYTTLEKANLLNLLKEYLEIGGFPEVQKFGKPMLSRIYNDIITKDILLRHKTKKVDELKKLARFLITNVSSEFTYRKLGKIFGIKNVSTISNWISFLEESFLIFKLEKFDFKLKQQFIAPKKVYCLDCGIINAIGFKFLENMGKIIENEVAIELQRRKSALSQFEIYYWKDYQQHEVDFVVKKGNNIIKLIQVTYADSREEIKEREIKSLLKARKELRCSNLMIITWDYEQEEEIENEQIIFVPLWKWLLQFRDI